LKTRKLGSTDLNLSVVGLGSWPFANSDQFGWGPQNEKDTIDTVHRAMEVGVNWLDAAPIYGRGQSEETVGKALKTMKKKPIIATKALFMWNSQGGVQLRLDKWRVREQCELSMKRLGVDVFDMYMIHWPFCAEYLEEAWETFVELKKEGKIRHLGVSNFNVQQMEMLQPIHPVEFLEPPYSMLERGIEDEIMGYCAKNKIGIVTYSSLQQGLLTGTPPDINKLTPKDCRRTSRQFSEPMYSLNLKLAPELTALAKKSGHTLAQMAIAWNLRRPEVTSALTGPRIPAEIEETVKAADWQLTKEETDTIEMLLAKRNEALNAIK
jgi:aryl-alcohol dehydrogenase-like predicted oxidoreductase